MFDAYTIKKVLPRLAIAVILIQLSWFLFTGMVVITNQIAYGVEALIYAPFGATANDFTLENLLGEQSGGQGIFLAVAAGATVAAPILGGVLFMAGMAALALVIGLGLLLFRQILIVALLIIAPLALVAWILPNTEKFWKLWWSTFTKLLLLYPMILGALAVGKAFAYITAISSAGSSGAGFLTGNAGNLLNTAIITLGFFAPFFLIPSMFRMTGGAFGAVAGAMRGITKPANKMMRAGMMNKWKHNRSQASDSVRWSNNNAFGRAANKAAGWAVSPIDNAAALASQKGANIPWLSAKGGRVLHGIEHAQREQTEKLFKEMNESGFNDKTFRTVAGLHSGLSADTQRQFKEAGLYGRELRTRADLAKASAILSHSDNAQERASAGILDGSAARLESLFQDPEMSKASVAGAGGIGLAAHGFASGADLAELGNKLQGGPHAMSGEAAQSIVTRAQLYGQGSRPDVKAGYGVTVQHGPGGKAIFTDGTGKGGSRALGLLGTISSGDIAGSKGGFLKEMGPEIKQVISRGRSKEGAAASKVVQSAQRRLEVLKASDPAKYQHATVKDVIMESRKGDPNAAQYADQAIYDAESHRIHGALVAELQTTAGQFSGASTDTRAQAVGLLDDLGIPVVEPGREPTTIDPSGGGSVNPPTPGATTPGFTPPGSSGP